MNRLNYLTLELYSLTRTARKIFSRMYEDITLVIFFDEQENYQLVIVNSDGFIISEREISRAEAFRIINTRS